jgi:hypothetical protein
MPSLAFERASIGIILPAARTDAVFKKSLRVELMIILI